MNYWLPYKWSKWRLAETIIKILPGWKRLVDMFWGWWAITHCASIHHKWKTIHYNDLDRWLYNLFSQIHTIDLQELKKRFVTRQEFIDITKKKTRTVEEDLILICRSFWNNMKGYMYWKNLEERKNKLHNLHFKIWVTNQQELDEALELLSQSRVYFDKYKIFYDMSFEKYKECKYFRTDLKKYILKRLSIDWDVLDDNELIYWINEKKKNKKTLLYSEVTIWSNSLQSLERLERLERLQSLESLQSLEYSNLSYDQIQLQEWDILYCDPPYEWTDWYRVWWFDHDKFRDFVRNTPYPCYVSSYNWPQDMFCFKTIATQKLSKSKDNSKQTERIYWNGK